MVPTTFTEFSVIIKDTKKRALQYAKLQERLAFSSERILAVYGYFAGPIVDLSAYQSQYIAGSLKLAF